MLTVRVFEKDVESVFEVETVTKSFKVNTDGYAYPVVVCWKGNQDWRNVVYGKVFVMNEKGATIATYILDTVPPVPERGVEV